MKTLALLLVFGALAYCQTDTSPPSEPNPVCLGLMLQNSNLVACSQTLSQLTSNISTITTFCAGQCATDLRNVYTQCGYTGTSNQIEVLCNGGTPTIPIPDNDCVFNGLQGQTSCLNALSNDPTVFCTSSCATGVSSVYTNCGLSGEADPINLLCGDVLGAGNATCLVGRLSTLNNCVTELFSSPTQFCSSECSRSVSSAYADCGFTDSNNIITSICTPGVTIQDPICLSGRLQNLQSCVSSFLMNVSSFCDSECSTALTTAYNDCGYSIGNPVTAACNPTPGVPDQTCLAGRLTQLETCTEELTNSAGQFCNSTCMRQLEDAYVDCGYPISDNPSYGVCLTIPNGPDPLCLAERQLGIQSCVNVFLTSPNSFCSSDCYPDLRDAYTSCGYTGVNNPFEAQCIYATGPDPLCLNRELLNVPHCFNLILTNLTGFCASDCFDEVSSAFTDCGYHNESNPANVCYFSGQGEDPLCVSSRIQTVDGCLNGFVNNPTSFCTTQCANSTRMIYNECGYTANNPVDQVCSATGTGDGGDAACLAGRFQNLGHCTAVLLSNSSAFCSSDCYDSVSDAYNECGYSGSANPVELSCSSGPTVTQDPVCLSGRLQSLTGCLTQLAVDPANFCGSQCQTDVSSAYVACGYTGFANPAEQGCLAPTDCLGSNTQDFQNCFAELSANPNNFCQSQCVANIRSIYTSCGLPETANPFNSFCGGLVPNVPGQPNPVCLSNGLQNLQSCLSVITSDPTNFCGTACETDLSTAYDECGYNDSNPVNLLCTATPSDNADLVCLTNSLQNLQSCISELATDPGTFCGSPCATDLGNAYTNCGFIESSNPVNLACDSGGLPNQETFCISGKLVGLQDCSDKIDDSDFCGSECEFDLRTAYSECGFTGTSNPVAIMCTGNENQPDTICLGSKLQNLQECVTNLFSDPTSICTEGTCAADIQSAYTDCGYSGTNNPIASTCSQTGGAETINAIPFMALTFLLVALAVVF